MKKRFNFIAICFFIIIVFTGNSLFAVETAPRISDREIIESLAEIKAGQKALKELMDKRFEQVDRRFEQIDKRFEQIDKRFEQIDKRFEQVDKRFEAITNRFDKRFEQMDKRFEAITNRFDKRSEQMDKRFEAITNSFNKRFEQMDKRFEAITNRFDKRFEQMFNLVLSLFGSLMILIIAVLGYSIWDRRTVTKKVSERVKKVEHDLDIKNIDGSRLVRLIAALKDLAKENRKLAEVMRSFNLL